MSEYKATDDQYQNTGDVVYNKLDKLESIVQDMYLALGYLNGELKSTAYKMNYIEAQQNLDQAEDLIAELIKINKDVHYVKSN
tara:strand:+ start:919 stop:1167 length:249 start_codon:yes stop_codon:yes gene_type:complete